MEVIFMATFIKVELEMGIKTACINVEDIVSVTEKGVYESEIKLRNGDTIIATEDPDDIYKKILISRQK
jgi:hypothetical protein